MKKNKPRVTQLTVGRLFNAGNYEHLRVEISVEVPKGVKASDTLLELGAIVARLRPIKKPFNYDEYCERLNKVPEQLTEEEKARIDDVRKIVCDYHGAVALRMAAIKKLDELGGTTKATAPRVSDDDIF